MARGSNTNATAGDARWVKRVQSVIVQTHNRSVIPTPGAFAGMFRLDGGNGKQTLAACADGVGTKVLLGIKANRLRGLGVDLVAMNVNDLITCGAKPLFFLDYIAVNKLEPKILIEVVKGISDGCKEAGCALLGGETSQMADMYEPGTFDLAGFAVGAVEQRRAVHCGNVAAGDVLIGLPSNGLHSNGYTLVRKWISQRRLKLNHHYDELCETLADSLMRPTKIYVQQVLSLLASYSRSGVVTGMAHITGGGLRENVGRILEKQSDAVIETSTWMAPPIFTFMSERGMTEAQMSRELNMGIGFVLAVRPRYAKSAVTRLKSNGSPAVLIGSVRRGRGKVLLRQ